MHDTNKSSNSPFYEVPRRALRVPVGSYFASVILKLLRLVRTSETSLALWCRDAPRGPYLSLNNDEDDDDDRMREREQSLQILDGLGH